MIVELDFGCIKIGLTAQTLVENGGVVRDIYKCSAPAALTTSPSMPSWLEEDNLRLF